MIAFAGAVAPASTEEAEALSRSCAPERRPDEQRGAFRIEYFTSDVKGNPDVRQLSTTFPLAGRRRMQLTACDTEGSKRKLYVGIFIQGERGDHSCATELSAREFDRLIENLLALREAARAEGLMHWPASTSPLARIRSAVRAVRAPAPGHEHIRTCKCASCEVILSAPFVCGDCGYRGRPLTLACECARVLAEHIHGDRFALDLGAKGWPADWLVSEEQVRARLAELESLSGVGRCAGMGTGQPSTSLFSFEGNCVHGSVMCPACESYGDGECEDSLLKAMLRDINAIVDEVAS